MNVKKFTAGSSRDAWRQIRETLGPDAVIFSNRNTDDGVEILAMASEDMPALAMSRQAMQQPPVQQRVAVSRDANGSGIEPSQAIEHSAAQTEARVWRTRKAVRTKEPQTNLKLAASGAQGPKRSGAVFDGKDYDEILSGVMMEIHSIRGVLETQLAEISWGGTQKREPLKAAVMREMLAAGFSASLSRLITENLPQNPKSQDPMFWVKSVLARNLVTMSSENELLEEGGIYALVGPTGVGKTTTTAKLAARCVMQHGPGKLALITTDGYRVGGYEQLRIYGNILGVMVHSVKDEADLRIALDELYGKHTVLIDTAGMGQRDQMVAEQAAMLSGAGAKIKRLLCLNATAIGSTLNEVVSAYSGDGLAGCIITKLDEAATIGNVLDVVIRQKLNLYYVANGQRVPEDLHVANNLYLADRAFKLKRETAPFEFQDFELPIVVGPTAMAMHDKSLREVILG
jgi:flagellar biosynthesis protein FlhF